MIVEVKTVNILKSLSRFLIKCYFAYLRKFNQNKYKKKYPGYLKKLGVNLSEKYVESGKGYIDPTVVFDASDYSLISIGEHPTISLEVIFLTHDWSIATGLKVIDRALGGCFYKPISIGDNCFIGMRTILLPGTKLGNNVIVGAGSVVKGQFPDNVMIAGNPAKIIAKTDEWAKKHLRLKDYIVR